MTLMRTQITRLSHNENHLKLPMRGFVFHINIFYQLLSTSIIGHLDAALKSYPRPVPDAFIN